MNRRITIVMAQEAADKMASAKYDSLINGLHDTLTDIATKLAVTHYPFPVLKVLEEYPDYFERNNMVCIHVVEDDTYFWSKSNIPVPYEKRVFDMAKQEAAQLIEVNADYVKTRTLKVNFRDEIAYVLGRELKYEEKVRWYLPEALPYIKFPEVVQPPALREDHYSRFRNLIKSIK